MKPVALQQFVKIRTSLLNEKTQLETRLKAVKAALGGGDAHGHVASAGPELLAVTPPLPKRGGRKARKPMSPEQKAKIAEAQRLSWAKKRKRGATRAQAAPAV